ncbi:MAG: long-chain fatty acid--CoA ligase [bacterium]|nr:long-chain fatty acid--CoA ligase [bacterium]
MSQAMPSTLPAMFLATAARFPERTAYGLRTDRGFDTRSWSRTLELVETLCAGWLELGLGEGDRLAILSSNRHEWMLADMAALFTGIVVVPVYPSLPSAHVLKVLADCGARAVLVEDDRQLNKVLRHRDQLPALERIILLDGEGPGAEGITPFDEVMEEGARRLAADPGEPRRLADLRRADEVFTIIYTSGTTGEQKGVMLTHGNLISNIQGALENYPITEEDVFLSFLPLSHIFERMAGYYFPISVGAAVYYARDITSVGEDLPVARPTILIAVPRLFEKIHARILENAMKGPKVKQAIFNWALGMGRTAAQNAIEGRAPGYHIRPALWLADRLVFGKIRERTGGRLRFAVSGGAPLRRDLGEFFLSVGLQIYEGYGLTESSPVLAANHPGHVRFGTVGKVYPGVELRLAPDGEILARGPGIMAGYYKRPQDTAQSIRDGWLHTGDIGRLDADGFLTITDRKKNLIVTSGGKNIAPQPIENLLLTSPLIEQVMLVGDHRNFVSALIVPNFGLLREVLGLQEGSPPPSTQQIADHPEVYERIDKEILRLSKELAPYERVRKFSVLGSEFSIESGELTPSLKIKRSFVLEKYGNVIEGMYLTSDHKDRLPG